MPADPKPIRRTTKPGLLRALHQRWRECALCGDHRSRLSLHHIHKHPRDDVEANLVMLCGDGVAGCHGAVEAGDREKRRELGLYISTDRPDTIEYLEEKLGGDTAARAWLTRSLYIEV